MDFQTYLDNIEKKLQGSFDIEKNYRINDYEYDLFARYQLRTEKYILFKQAVIDAMENYEYCLIKHFHSVNKDNIKEYTGSLIKSVDKIVNPNEEHMSSIITGIIVSDNMPDFDIIDSIKRFKYHKGFAFGFKGWVDIRLILVTMEDEYIVTNKKGKEVKEVYSV